MNKKRALMRLPTIQSNNKEICSNVSPYFFVIFCFNTYNNLTM